jgi:hypothetical protein
MPERTVYLELRDDAAYALIFSALYGLYSATPADDSSDPAAVYRFKAKALDGLKATGLEPTQIHRLIEALMHDVEDQLARAV